MSEVFKNLDLSVLTDMLYKVIPALLCVVFHELSHGYVALRLGDRTAKEMGRLSLNPIRHVDIIGLLMMVTVGFGWAKPVPIDPYHFKNPKRGMAITALAGPMANLLLAVVFLFVYGCLYRLLYDSGIGWAVLQMLLQTAILSVYLAIFNILPIPPMDGSKFFFSFASDRLYFKLMRYERYGLILVLLLSVSGRLAGPLSIAFEAVFDKLFIFARAGQSFTALFA